MLKERATELFHANGDVMTAAQLAAAKIYPVYIQRLLKDGTIERIARGLYQLTDNDNFSEALVVKRLFPASILCLDTALFYHGYSDRTPSAWHLAFDKHVYIRRTQVEYPFIRPYYVESGILELGAIDCIIDEIPMRIYDKDRTICDCLRYMNKMDRELFNKAIQGYVIDPKKNIPNLMQYAKPLRVQKKVKDLIGVWL